MYFVPDLMVCDWIPVLCFLFGGGVAGNLFACLPKTEDQGGVGGGVALGMGGQDGGERVIPGEGDGGGADPVELGEDAGNNFKVTSMLLVIIPRQISHNE